jgi:hypothetical protein
MRSGSFGPLRPQRTQEVIAPGRVFSALAAGVRGASRAALKWSPDALEDFNRALTSQVWETNKPAHEVEREDELCRAVLRERQWSARLISLLIAEVLSRAPGPDTAAAAAERELARPQPPAAEPMRSTDAAVHGGSAPPTEQQEAVANRRVRTESLQQWRQQREGDSRGAASVASFQAAVLAEIYLCNVCSC